MQHRMRTYALSSERSARLLREAETGNLATVNADGTPYATPVHFVFREGCIYFHGLPAGQKAENIRRSPCVCFNVWRMDGLLPDPEGAPCDTNTRYQSVTVQGRAAFVTDPGEKARALREIVEKYTPQLWDRDLPEGMVRGTAVVRVEPESITGKYYGPLDGEAASE